MSGTGLPPPGDTPPVTQFQEGERLLASWKPQMFLFAQRALMLSFATAVALASLGYLTLVQWLIAVPVFTIIFLVVFDDITTWFRHRNDHWHLTNRRLIYERKGAPEEDAALPLHAIEWMRPWLWWSLQLGFQGGTSTAMRFVARPRDIQSRILAAQKAATPPSPNEDTETDA